jgi:hypothetical protein
MKKSVIVLCLLALLPVVLAQHTGSGLAPIITTASSTPDIWMCNTTPLIDSGFNQGRDMNASVQRTNNYAFAGEQIEWTVLVYDRDGLDDIRDVYATVGRTQGPDNPEEVGCSHVAFVTASDPIGTICNSGVASDVIDTIASGTAELYDCLFTVEPSPDMYGEYYVTIEVEDDSFDTSIIDENVFWFFNPIIGLRIEGDLIFEDLLPGETGYSETILLGNNADAGSGVMMDMFISGENFYDSGPSSAICPTTNELSLSNFRYYASNGAYNTANDIEDDDNAYDPATLRNVDGEGYVNIQFGDHFHNTMYNEAEVIQVAPINGGVGGYSGNIISCVICSI